MTSIATKLIAGIASAGVVGGTGYGVHVLTNTSDSVDNYLKKHNFKVIAHGDNTKWEKAFKTYELEKEESQLKITGETITDSNGIKGWCNSNLKKTIKSTEELLYQQVARWCTEYTTIKENLKDKTLEDNATTLDGKYKNLPPKIKNQIDAVDITTNTHQNGARIKKWCEDNVNRKYFEGDQIYFATIRDNCFKPN